jgi:cellulose 1,4-beta-cellobiosidase
MYQIFIQNGKVIEVPAPNIDGIPSDTNTINPEFCEAAPKAFGDRDRFGEVGGYSQLNRALELPMVLVMSIWSDVSASPPLFFGLGLASCV